MSSRTSFITWFLKILFGILALYAAFNLMLDLPIITQQEILDNGISQGIVTFVEPFIALGLITLWLSFWHTRYKKMYKWI